MDLADIRHRQNLLDVMNNFDPPTVEKNFGKFTDSIKSEIDTVFGNDTLNAIEADIRTFETTVKEALDNFTNGLLNLVQEQKKLFNLTYDELINAVSEQFHSDDSNPVAEVPDIEITGDIADSATTGPQSSKFHEFEINFREKFIAALDELLNGLREATYVQDEIVDRGNGAAYANLSGNYNQMIESTNSNNHGSEHEPLWH